MRIITDGYHGSDGSSGMSGCGYGSSGSRGMDGTDGGHANDIRIVLRGDGAQCYVTGTHSGTVPHGPSSEIFMSAVGGRGGHGGRGGDGASGHPGHSGSDATQYSSGTNGGPGGRGGDGGSGGHGGDGGNGGVVAVQALQEDMDLFMLVNRANVSGGPRGQGGAGGCGGSGGPGGRGGNSYSWTTSETYTDNEGRTQTRTHHHSNPGGHSGCSGSSGTPGMRGRDGRDGRDGSYALIVSSSQNGSTQSYGWRYVAKAINYRVLDLTTKDGVFEPGERCEMEYGITNTGPMPTPLVQRLVCSVFPNAWINNPTGEYSVTPYVPHGSCTAITAPVNFDIPLIPEPPPNTYFITSTMLEYSVHVERVRKYFTRDELGAGNKIIIQYPLRSSATHGPATVTATEIAPIAIAVHNLSLLPLGALHGRVARVQLGLVSDANSMTPLDPVGRLADLIDAFDNVLPMYSDAFNVQSKQNVIPGVFVRFRPEAPLYSKITLGIQLFLGHIHDFQREHRIQRASLDLQIASYYKKDVTSSMLVVTSHATTRESFLEWHNFSRATSHNPNFWNATIHGGLTLEQVVNGSSLKNDFKGRTVVVENCDPEFLSIVRTERNAAKESPFDTVCRHELATAMREKNIGFAVIGGNVDWRNKLLPTDTIAMVLPKKQNWTTRTSSLNTTHWQDQLFPYHSFFTATKMVEDLQRNHRYSERTAWQIAHGHCVSMFGEIPEPIEVVHFDSLEARIQCYFDHYAPWTKKEVLADICKAHHAQGANGILKALEPYFGPEEFATNQYRLVRKTVLVSGLNPTKIKKMLIAAANELYEEVTKLRPQWKFLVMYDVAPHLQRVVPLPPNINICGLNYVLHQEPVTMFKEMIIGKLWVSRAADRNGACVQEMPLAEKSVSVGVIQKEHTQYTVCKAQPFGEKIRVLSGEYLANPRNSSIMRAAMLSDLTEEQVALRRNVWTGPLLEAEILDHCPRLCAFVARGCCDLETTEMNDFFQNVVCDVLVLLDRWVRWYDVIMMQRMCRLVSSVCSDLLQPLAAKVGATPGRVKARKEKVKDTTLEDLIEQCATGPYRHRSSQSIELERRVVSWPTVQHLFTTERPPLVVTDRWLLPLPRDRCVALHKIRSEFSPQGVVSDQTTRADQEARQSFLGCPGYHVLGDCPAAFPCGVCGVTMTGVWRCEACNWNVCYDCWAIGNTQRWQYRVELEHRPEPPAWDKVV